eukprot:SAG31_NODE_4118_length_3565_cov_2.083670_7_plen_86_part_00
MKYYQPATERSVKNVAANVDGAKVTIVVLGGPQTAGDLYERVIGALHPAERDHIDLIDARELFQVSITSKSRHRRAVLFVLQLAI